MGERKKPLLVVGSLNMDLVVTAKHLPTKGETVLGNTFATFPGGKGANQAVAAAKLGADVTMVGCIGQDSFGEQLSKSLEASRVRVNFLKKVNCSTGTALITVEDSGANTIVVVAGANGYCAKQDVDQALSVLTEPGILLVQHEVPVETVEYAIKMAKTQGWTVILNPAPARQVTKGILSLVDILTPNETETAFLSGSRVDNMHEAEEAAQKLLASGIATVIITLGEKGALCCRAGETHYIPSYEVTAVDTTAAGDAYTGALAAALAEGKSLLDSAHFAAAAAALSVTKAGAQPSLPFRREVEQFIISREENK